ncbi:MOSC domain-containing protein [Desulfoplanes formicivorans]|uniref:Molybdenum cofactor sulfurase n=1 Tax=Desulfoplanes formicivorans TaxID=1592317 RepID=A0A194AL66_9BACT|nr:MOSC domain-containing protein [Desulfoplanes formicivorans]GAU09781.1 molybdenum cofactor sulfurase [Desulfoplanes formicivorans]
MKVVSIALSAEKGTRKTPVTTANLIAEHGLEGDAHAGKWHRQVSFLAGEDIQAARDRGIDVDFGDFAENIGTQGVDWPSLPVGTRVRLGKDVLVEVTQIGKKCHVKCAIYELAGECIMPKRGVFARVLHGGQLSIGDPITIE